MKTGVHKSSAPARLSCEQFFPPQTALVRLYRQTLQEPVAIHWHEFYEMFFILAGEGTHLLNGVEHQLLPGVLCLLTPTDFHAITPSPTRPLELFNVIFTAEVFSVQLQHLLFKDEREVLTQLDGEDIVTTTYDFQRLWSEFQEQRTGYHIALQATLANIFVMVSRSTPLLQNIHLDVSRNTMRHDIHQALTYMQHHFREPLTLEEVARHAMLSPNYFSECFHQTTGQQFQRYLQCLRLRFARSLLSVSSLPVTTICFSTGFTSLAHFERTFKQQFGLSPRAYQQHCSQEEKDVNNASSSSQ